RAQVVLPLSAAKRMDVQAVTLDGTALAIVRVSAGDGHEAAALLGRGESGHASVIWSGALDLRGDPGERIASSIEVQSADGEQQHAIIVGVRSERARICGQPPALLYPRRLDPASLQLKPVALPRVPAVPPPTLEL